MSSLTKIRHAANAASKRRKTIIWLIAILIALVLPHTVSTGFGLAIMIQMGIAIIFAVAYNMLLGQGGMLSFGHAVYFGLGGFLAMHAINHIGNGIAFPIPLTPIVGGVFGLLFAFFIGSFSTRRSGTVFAMISLGIGELIAAMSLIFVAFFGGEEGISGDRTEGPNILEAFGVNYGSELEVYYVVATWTLITVFTMYMYSRTPVGRMANAVRDNPERAEFVGYSQRTIRWISFCASGFFAGIAGGLFAIAYEIVTEETLNAVTSGGPLLMAYIGGVGAFIGPIIGAIVFTLLSTLLSSYTEIWQLYVGMVFVLVVMFVPGGLTGILMLHTAAWRNKNLSILVKPYLALAVPVVALICGGIGLLESVHFLRNTIPDERMHSLFFVTHSVDSIFPWLIFGTLFVMGILFVKRIAPLVVDRWEFASDPVNASIEDDLVTERKTEEASK